VSHWQDIDTMPTKPGSEFLVLQDGEIYHARREETPPYRLLWRTHGVWEPKEYRVQDVEVDGETTKRSVLMHEGPDEFHHNWTIWTRLFEFAPTHWAPLPYADPYLEGADGDEAIAALHRYTGAPVGGWGDD
jgi:hypothetical protein